MSRKIIKQEYLPLILRYFSQNPQERNTKHFQAPLAGVTFDRVTSTHLYRLFSETAEQPNIGRVLRAVEDVLRSRTKRQDQDSGNEEAEIELDESLPYHVSKVAALSKHSLPVEGEVKKLKQLILFNELLYSDFQILLKHITSVAFGHSSLTVADLIMGTQLLASPIKLYPSQMTSISHQIFPILANRQKSILISKIQEDIHLYSRHQIEALSFPNKSGLLALLRKQALLQNSPVKKRMIYRLMLAYMGEQGRIQDIPGKDCQSEEELKEGMIFLKASGRMVPFVDLFSTTQRTVKSLKGKFGCQWLRRYIDFYCIFVENGCYKLSCEQIKSCMQPLSRLEQVQIYGLLQSEFPTTVLKALILFSIFNNFHELLTQNQKLQMIIRSCLQVLKSKEIDNIDFSGQNQQFLKLVGCFVIRELNRHLKTWKEARVAQHILNLQTINLIVQSLPKKSENSLISKLPSIYSYARVISSGNISTRSLCPSILYSDSMPKEKLQQIVDIFLDVNSVNIVNIQDILLHLYNKYTIHTKVILQPSFYLSYLISQKATGQPLYAFDVASLATGSCVYDGDIREGEGFKLVDERLDLNPYGLWKCQWIQEVMGLQYFYCLTEQELAIKMCRVLGVDKMIR